MGDDFAGIDFGVVGEDVWPPLVFVELFEVHDDALAVFDGPGAVFFLDLLGQLTLWKVDGGRWWTVDGGRWTVDGRV